MPKVAAFYPTVASARAFVKHTFTSSANAKERRTSRMQLLAKLYATYPTVQGVDIESRALVNRQILNSLTPQQRQALEQVALRTPLELVGEDRNVHRRFTAVQLKSLPYVRALPTLRDKMRAVSDVWAVHKAIRSPAEIAAYDKAIPSIIARGVSRTSEARAVRDKEFDEAFAAAWRKHLETAVEKKNKLLLSGAHVLRIASKVRRELGHTKKSPEHRQQRKLEAEEYNLRLGLRRVGKRVRAIAAAAS